MAKKQKSFADKAAARGSKDVSYIKYVKSVESDKPGFWRFNEQMIAMEKGETIDAALKRINEEKTLAGIEMPVLQEESSEKTETVQEEAEAEEAPEVSEE